MRVTLCDRPPGRFAPAAMIFVCLTGCTRTQAGDTLDQVRHSGVFRVALTEASPPWNFLDREGRLKGYDVSVAREVAKRINATRVRFIGADFATFIGGVRAGKYDLVVSGQTVTAERRKEVDFSRPYALNSVAVFVRTGNTTIHGPADLPGKKIGVSEGTVQTDFARTRIRHAKVTTYENAVLAQRPFLGAFRRRTRVAFPGELPRRAPGPRHRTGGADPGPISPQHVLP
jgi:cystine transport system substrate-binding protein